MMNSKRIPANFLFVMVLTWLLHADTCTVASGQTVAFTLSAGAKASWNSTKSGVRQWQSPSRNGTSFSVYQVSNGIVTFRALGFRNDISSKISLFSVNGRKMWAAEMNGRTTGIFTSKLIPGIYFARFEVDGACMKTVRFLVGR
jgi:hypothetical protein